MKIAVSISLTLPTNPDKAEFYLEGFRRNTEKIPQIYPGAEIVLHHDETVPDGIISLATKSRKWPRRNDATCMFWRFTTVGDPDYDAVLIRDADSIPNEREAHAVQEWLDSGLPFHTMHDHPAHADYRIMGGMWGARRGAFPYDFKHLVEWWIDHKNPFGYNADQWFLTRYLYPYTERQGMNHSGVTTKFLNQRMFPDGPSPASGYVGERISMEADDAR